METYLVFQNKKTKKFMVNNHYENKLIDVDSVAYAKLYPNDIHTKISMYKLAENLRCISKVNIVKIEIRINATIDLYKLFLYPKTKL